MADAGPYVDGTINLTPGAEQAFQRAAEACGGYVVDRDVAAQASATSNFLTDCEIILELAWASRRPVPLDA